MKTEEELKGSVEKFATQNTSRRNPSPDGEKNNAAVVQQIGGHFAGGGVRDIDKAVDDPENRVDQDTMFAEGSIGKIRYAGLAYMMQEAGVLDLQQNAREFFEGTKVGVLLDEKYPGKNMQDAILGLFTGGSEEATIADLTTHRSGIGDTTSDTLNREKVTGGAEHDYSLPDLVLSSQYSVVPRDENNKPQAKKGIYGELAPAVYGDHEYSNLGYQILAEAMELAYEMKTGSRKSYQQLTEDFMLHPIEGPAVGKGLDFGRTMFPGSKDFTKDDNVIQAKLMQDPSDLSKGTRSVNGFNGAGAAGGIFTSAGDSAKFFTEYFRGFPGTDEYGQEGVNPFFSADTIDLMAAEGLKHESLANQPMIDKKAQELQEWKKDNSLDLESSQGRPIIPNPQFQLPGAVLTTDNEGNFGFYVKGGGTPGYGSRLEFDIENGGVNISMINQENVTPAREKEAAQRAAGEVASVAAEKKLSYVEKLGLENRDGPGVAVTNVERYATGKESGEKLDSFVKMMDARVADQAKDRNGSR